MKNWITITFLFVITMSTEMLAYLNIIPDWLLIPICIGLGYFVGIINIEIESTKPENPNKSLLK